MAINQEALNNQQELRNIIKTLGITQAQAAALIKKETNQAVSTRKMRSWLANPEAQSARSCPSWAITAFKKAILDLQVSVPTENEEKEDKQILT